MKLILEKGILFTCLLTALPAFAEVVDTSRMPAPLKFKLGVSMQEAPLFADQREIKPMPTVDSALINQMMNVRQGLPSWQGVHHLVPGTGAASGH